MIRQSTWMFALIIVVSLPSFSAAQVERFGGVSQKSAQFGPVTSDQNRVSSELLNSKVRVAEYRLDEESIRRSLRALGKERYANGFGSISRSGKIKKPDASLRDAAGEEYDNKLSQGSKQFRQYQGLRVHGSDDRIQIKDTTTYPFRTIGMLHGFKPSGSGYCTATLIGERVALTAAHCVYDHDEGGWLERNVFVPGANGENAPFGTYEMEDAIIPSGFIDNWSGEYDGNVVGHDVALILLESNPGAKLGFLQFGFFDPTRDFVGNIVGYPGDKPDSTMWRATCDFLAENVSDESARHECDTTGGNSGSAVYDYEKRTNTRVVVGVHVAGTSEYDIAVHFGLTYYEWINDSIRDF